MIRKTAAFGIVVFALFFQAQAARYNAFGLKLYTVETPHFRIHYHDGLAHLVKPVADKLEFLYGIYAETYDLKLPSKTDIMLVDSDESNGLTFTNINFILLAVHDFDYNMRGTHDWFDDVISHEYAHQVSIWTSFKFKSWIPYVQLGYFTHPNEQERLEALHVLPGEILPMWLAEGIAQFESSRHGSDSWDTHRDMILRSLTLSDNLISWDHMQLFAGRGDDFEKTYDHGFSMVRYIAEKYGYEKIVAMVKESAKLRYFNFDAVIRNTLGMPASTLYDQWKSWLKTRYARQRDSLGTLVTGKKINKDGFENYWPRFSPDGKKIFYLSNAKNEYSFRNLYSYMLSDTIKEDKKVKFEMAVKGFYDIHQSGRIAFCSPKSKKSILPAGKGGVPVKDLFIDTLPPDKKKFRLLPKKTEKQLTFRQSIFSAAFSPTGDMLAAARRDCDRFYLVLVDSAGKTVRIVYPDSGASDETISFIYSLAWSPDGRSIAFSYFDCDNRKIGIYDTACKSVHVVCDTRKDERDPYWSPDGKRLYFASDRTGIFNIYRYDFDSCSLSRLTNVLGGAFAPSVSPDEKQLAYAGYDSSGYGIFFLDSLKPLSVQADDSALAVRGLLEKKTAVPISYPSPKPFSYMPRQFLCIPTAIVEQLVSTESNVFAGSPRFKAGAVFNLVDPAVWMGKGSEIGGYLLFEPHRFYQFINLDHGGIDIRRTYDAGVFASTARLPFTLSFDYLLRGIAGEEKYFNDDQSNPYEEILPYNIRIHHLYGLISHYFQGGQDITGIDPNLLAVQLLAGLNRYDVDLQIPGFGIFNYNLGKGYRAGAIAALGSRVINSRSSISPQGLAVKTQYNFWRQFSLQEENSFSTSSSYLKENYDFYRFHEGIGHLMAGMSAPWYGRHDFHFDLRGNVIKILEQDTVFPSFYLPVAWIPGYAYYFRDTKIKSINVNQDTIRATYDTVTVTGRAVVNGGLSYRFPLSPSLIDKRIWIIYLEKLYGCLNLSGGAGFTRPSRILDFNREDWLVSYGAEIRLQASTFNGMPLAVRLRWDRGIDRPAPLGGDRFTLGLGFDFDNWGLIMLPDYRTPAFVH